MCHVFKSVFFFFSQSFFFLGFEKVYQGILYRSGWEETGVVFPSFFLTLEPSKFCSSFLETWRFALKRTAKSSCKSMNKLMTWARLAPEDSSQQSHLSQNSGIKINVNSKLLRLVSFGKSYCTSFQAIEHVSKETFWRSKCSACEAPCLHKPGMATVSLAAPGRDHDATFDPAEPVCGSL